MRTNKRTGLAGLLTGALVLLLLGYGNAEDLINNLTMDSTFDKRMPIKKDVPGNQTAILRMRAVKDLPACLDEIRSMGATVISENKRTIVIEAPKSVLEELRHHSAIIAIDEPKQMQILPSPKDVD